MLNSSQFYLVIPPGFESIAFDELNSLHIDVDSPEFEADLKKGFELNHKLRVPTRILLRVDSFKARDFPKLFHKLQKITWRLWLWSDKPDIFVSSSESRLIHTDRIKETVLSAIKRSLNAQPFSIKHANYFDFAPQVYIRIHLDQVVVSLDTSYPPLYKRELNKSGHPASIRENLAYGCWSLLKKHIKDNEINLIDPMCGSGTFLLEAIEVSKRQQFAYLGFPYTQKHMHSFAPSFNSLSSDLFINAYGFDINENFIQENQKHSQIKWSVQDLFQDTHTIEGNNIVITNPPYNKRIKIDKNIADILKAIHISYRPKLRGIIIPRDQISQIESLKEYQAIDHIDFRNGGIPCRFQILSRQD